MALTQANLQTAKAFAYLIDISPDDAVRILRIALLTPFFDSSANIQMVQLTVGADGVTVTIAYEVALALYQEMKAEQNGGIVPQLCEFVPTPRRPGQQP